MVWLSLLLNLPWTLVGLVGALLSGPTNVSLSKKPPAIIIRAKSFWWLDWVPTYRGVRGGTLGNTVILGPKLLEHDLEHEFIHVEQSMRRPLVQPILYGIESLKHGHKYNRFEQEAYQRAGNKYLD